MEEDTGKSLHVGGATGRIHGAEYSLVDYNRAGIPLIEIVTQARRRAPAHRAPEVAKAYVGALRDLLRGLGVSDVRMEQGSLRCDANVSLRAKVGEPTSPEQHAVPLGTRTETKNVNSLRSVERAVRFEVSRHAARAATPAAGSSRRPGTGTRTPASPRRAGPRRTPRTTGTSPSPTWCRSSARRSGSSALRARAARAAAVRRRPAAAADWGFTDLEMRDVVNAGARRAGRGHGGRRRRARRRPQVVDGRPRATRQRHRHRARRPAGDAGAGGRARRAWWTPAGSTTPWPGRCSTACWPARASPEQVATARGLEVVSDDGALGEAVDGAIAANPDVADKIRAGKHAAAGALIGAVMKEMRGQADAARVREMVLERLGG